MDTERYGELLKGCRLRRVRLVRSRAEIKVRGFEELRRELNITEPISRSERHPDGIIVMEMACKLAILKSTGRAQGVVLEAVWQLELRSDAELPDEFLEQYLTHNLELNLWPYWRQWVTDTTGRLGLPPVTVPFRVR